MPRSHHSQQSQHSQQNYGHTVYNAQLPGRRLPPTPDRQGDERRQAPLRGYDDDERSLPPMPYDSADDLGPPPHHRDQTLKQHVAQQRQQGYRDTVTYPVPERQDRYRQDDPEPNKKSSTSNNGCFPESKLGRANCCACIACGCLILLTIVGILAVIAWKVLYCQLKDGDSEPNIGTPNFYMGCKGLNNSLCQVFDYEYNGTKKGGGSCCSNNDDYLCEYPTVPALLAPTPANQIKVMTFNIFERPYFIGREGQRERTCRIPRWIFNNAAGVDVIGFQELFTDGCWGGKSSMREMLKQHGFLYSTPTVAEGKVPVSGGTFIASRWPIEVEKRYRFDERNLKTIIGLFIPKGINYVKIKKSVGGSDKVYHVFNTHFEAFPGADNDKVREAQAAEMKTFIDQQNIPATDPVILTGDFNIDFHSITSQYNKVFNDTLKTVLPTNSSALVFSHDTQTNKLYDATTDQSDRSMLDYVVYSSEHQLPTTSSFEILEPKWTSPMKMCWDPEQVNTGAYRFPDANDCHKTSQFIELSDHSPVVADFMFP